MLAKAYRLPGQVLAARSHRPPPPTRVPAPQPVRLAAPREAQAARLAVPQAGIQAAVLGAEVARRAVQPAALAREIRGVESAEASVAPLAAVQVEVPAGVLPADLAVVLPAARLAAQVPGIQLVESAAPGAQAPALAAVQVEVSAGVLAADLAVVPRVAQGMVRVTPQLAAQELVRAGSPVAGTWAEVPGAVRQVALAEEPEEEPEVGPAAAVAMAVPPAALAVARERAHRVPSAI